MLLLFLSDFELISIVLFIIFFILLLCSTIFTSGSSLMLLFSCFVNFLLLPSAGLDPVPFGPRSIVLFSLELLKFLLFG
jgi:uncharacterized SAM-binding protein YcdF (DUF218 family)